VFDRTVLILIAQKEQRHARTPGYPYSGAQVGDGVGLARSWVDAGAYYAKLNPDLFQVPVADGLADSLEAGVLKSASEKHLVRVAEIDMQVVGAVGASFHAPAVDAAHQFVRDGTLPRIIIDLLFVWSAYWRHGIGKQLLEAAETGGRNKGAVMSLLGTYVDSPVSVPFYEHGMAYQRRGLWAATI
jgi:GNAT superfamily N-acetyltransferase